MTTIIVIWVLCCMTSRCVISGILKSRNLDISVKMPKALKWKTKVEPIYLVKEHDSMFHSEKYVIVKYIIKWNKIEMTEFFLTFLFPWPIAIWKFGYGEENRYYFSKDEILSEEAHPGKLGEMYEKRKKELKEAHTQLVNEIEASKRESENTLKMLNTEFNTHFEKLGFIR